MCDHQFLKITEIIRSPKWNGDGLPPRGIPGIIAGCALCGETRQILENGELTILKAGLV